MPPKVQSKTETVKVVVRCRPLNSTENNHKVVVVVDEAARRISVENPNPDKHAAMRDFTFDATFAPGCKQEAVFEDTALPILDSVLEGYNGTIFAYGQTGTGKTFTMEGSEDKPELMGIVPRSIKHIFNAISEAANTKKYLVRMTFLELYNEELIDLLPPPKTKNKDGREVKKERLQIHQKPNEGIKVHGLTDHFINTEKEITHKYNAGKAHRTVASTKMNSESSRSHSILTIIIENEEEVNGKMTTRMGKLNLVDLAGSERQDKTEVTGLQREQAININLSLTTLGSVIRSLSDPKSTYTPYRDSLLTRLLQDSLGGNTKTVMIANVGPSGYNYDETLSTLNYANQAKNIKNDVRINEDPKDALLRQFQEQIKRLREQVAKSLGVEGGPMLDHPNDEEDVEEFEEKLRLEQDGMKKKFEEEKAEIYKKKNILDEEKNQLLKVIEQKQKEQALYKQNQESLINKLKKMEEKVLTGKEEVEAAMQKAELLKKKRQQVQEKREIQRKIEQDLKKKENSIENMNEIYKSMQEEHEDMSSKIKQKVKRLKILEAENKDLEAGLTKDIDELQERRRLLQKELKLKNFIIDYFVPAKYIEMINKKVVYNEATDDWVLPNLQISGNQLRLHSPEAVLDREELDQDEIEEIRLNEFVKDQLENHPNVYYAYGEQGLVREIEQDPAKTKKTKKNRKTKV